MSRLELDVIDPSVSCDDCGVCCLHLRTPPFLDYEIPHVPVELMAEVDAENALHQTYDPDGPCIWFDVSLKRCKHHEHKPDVCRDFLVGGEDCLNLRAEEQ